MPSPMAAIMSIAQMDGSGTALGDPLPARGAPSPIGAMVTVAPAATVNVSTAMESAVSWAADDPSPTINAPPLMFVHRGRQGIYLQGTAHYGSRADGNRLAARINCPSFTTVVPL